MTPELSRFAAQLREVIRSQGERRSVGPARQQDGHDGACPSNSGGAPPVLSASRRARSGPSRTRLSALRDDNEFDALALGLFALQFKHNAPYRRFCEARGASPRTVTDWREIPAMPAAAFKEWELSCLPDEERAAVFHSSGTSGQRPSRHFHSADSLAVYEASVWSWFVRHMFADLRFTIDDLRLVILTPPPALAPHSSLVHMFETVRRKLTATGEAFIGRVDKDGSWLLDFGSVTWAMECSRWDWKPMLLLGTAFSFVHLVDQLGKSRREFTLPPGSRVMETGGYKGRSRSLSKPELHALITRRLGIAASNIVCEYGMSELSSQAYDASVGRASCPQPAGLRGEDTAPYLPVTGHFSFPPWARVQIVSPETGREVAEGETGLIQVFDLANVFSVLAIQTEDLGVRRGDGFELLGRATLAEPRGCSLLLTDGSAADALEPLKKTERQVIC